MSALRKTTVLPDLTQRCFLGLDLGKRVDRSALAILELEWQNDSFDQAEYVPFRIRAPESQRLSADLLEMARLELGDAYAQEFECEFAMGAEQLFDRSLIDQALDLVIVAFR